MFKIKKMNEDELREIIYSGFDDDGYPSINENIFKDFTYFTPDTALDIQREKIFISAFEKDEIIGIIKCAKFTSFESDDDVLGVCYVDVKKSFRNQKIATKLIKQFFELTKKENTTISYESDLGATCNIHNLFKRYSDGRYMYFN